MDTLISWREALRAPVLCLYAGELPPHFPQFDTHFGLSPLPGSSRTICHDLRDPMPIPDACVTLYQAEDVLEHIAYETLPAVIREIHRVLRPGGLFRLSVPDYRFDVYANRCWRDEAGQIIFDPGGGGGFCDGQVVEGGHLWFPVFETVAALLADSLFATQGQVSFLHYTRPDGSSVLDPIDHAQGRILRTPDHDPRSATPRRAQSIVVDCRKALLSETGFGSI
jgi:SAM-dependent methyltransferase